MPSARAIGHLLPDPLLSRFSEFLAARLGLSFPRERWGDLERALAVAAKDFGFQDAESCMQWLRSSPLTTSQVEILASHLTVGETYFFREKAIFSALQEYILPGLIRSRRETERRIRIWSAGCCTGEEPYSIAIALTKVLPDIKDWNITLLASDINPRFLRKASLGIYDNWSFRDAPPGLKETYFTQTNKGRFEIAPRIKALVTYAYLNLADDVYPSVENNTNAMDIVFCRNVLMYFQPERAKSVIEKLRRSLVEGGWLIVSPVEASLVALPDFAIAGLPDVILYRKDTNGVRENRATQENSGRAIDPPSVLYEQPAGLDVREIPQTGDGGALPQEGDAHRPPTPEQVYLEASICYAQGRYAEAVETAQALLSQDANHVETMALLARAYANQGHLADAMSWCNRAIAADKLNPGWPYLLASILQERGQAEEAIAALKRTLYLEQNYALAHFALGNLMRRQGKHKQSSRHFGNALSILSGYRRDQVLPESEGITAGRLIEIIRSTMAGEVSA